MVQRQRSGGTGVNRPPTVHGFGFRNIEQQQRFHSLCLLAASRNGGDWDEAVPLVWGELAGLWEISTASIGRMMQAFTDSGLVESVHRGNQKRGSYYLVHRAEEFLALCQGPAQAGSAEPQGGAEQRTLTGGERTSLIQYIQDHEHEFFTEDGQLRR